MSWAPRNRVINLKFAENIFFSFSALLAAGIWFIYDQLQRQTEDICTMIIKQIINVLLRRKAGTFNRLKGKIFKKW